MCPIGISRELARLLLARRLSILLNTAITSVLKSNFAIRSRYLFLSGHRQTTFLGCNCGPVIGHAHVWCHHMDSLRKSGISISIKLLPSGNGIENEAKFLLTDWLTEFSYRPISNLQRPLSQSRNPFGKKRKTSVVAPTSIDILGKNENKNEAKEAQKRGTQLVRARVATERQTWTKKGGYFSDLSKNKGATEHQTKKQNKQKTGTGNVRAMPEGGGNTSPRKVRICATMTSQ